MQAVTPAPRTGFSLFSPLGCEGLKGHPVAAGWRNGAEQEAVMAHGEADSGCADAESQPHEPDELPPAPAGRPLRRICAGPTAERVRVDRADDPADDDDPLECHIGDHVADAASGPMLHGGRSPACRSERPGWAGAHRHGAVRPRRRASRRERPPDRWC
jgi:hypothetical protein